MGFYFVIKKTPVPPAPPPGPEEPNFIFEPYIPPEGEDADFIFNE